MAAKVNTKSTTANLLNIGKNILIMGCSFGVPNYFGPPGVAAEDHTELLLIEREHQVYNCSMNGGSNFQSLGRAKNLVQGLEISHPAFFDQKIKISKPISEPFDLVIWFHTQLYRDFDNRSLKDLAADVYSQYAEFFQIWAARTAVIGGAGDIHDEFWHWITPDFCIPSWKRQILDQPDLPLDHGQLSVIEHLDLSLQEKNEILLQIEKIHSALRMSEHFPDDCHPGTLPHRDLCDDLIQRFSL